MFIKRILGVVIIVTALLGMAVCCIVIGFGQPVFDRLTDDIVASLNVLDNTLDTVSETLQLAQVTSSQVITGLQTSEYSLLYTARAISDTRPLVTGTGEILTVDVANSIDSVQTSVPILAQLAGNIDKTLSFLSKVRILGFSLGVDYNPATPLDQSITAIGNSFNGIPGKLRTLSGTIDMADRNLVTMAINLSAIGSNLDEISTSVSAFTGLLTQYLGYATTAKLQLQAIQVELRNDLQAIKMGLWILFIWLGLTQVAPLYLGIKLLIKPHAA